MKSFIEQILGCQLPHPEIDFPAFTFALRRALDKEAKVFDPIKSSFEPWVDLAALARQYNSSSSTSTSACSVS